MPALIPLVVAFTRFWTAHPRAQRIDSTAEAFLDAVRCGVDPHRMADAAEDYRIESKGKARRYVLNSVDWLDGRRWTDQAAGPAQVATSGDVAAFWSARIAEGAYVAPSAISPQLAREMLDRRLVDRDTLRDRGIAA